MSEYVIVTNPIELISGTANRTSPAYVEAAKDLSSGDSKTMGYLKNFLTSIESVASQEGVQDPRIAESRGNIKSFSGYGNITSAIGFVSKNLHGSPMVKDLTIILKCIESYQSQYIDGYEKQVRLITLEYESAVYMLVTGLSFVMANNLNIESSGNKILITKKSGNDKGIITKIITELARELNSTDHKNYLLSLLNIKENLPVNEEVKPTGEAAIDTIGDTMDTVASIIRGVGKIGNFIVGTFKRLKNTLFGIIPLIRSILYLRYKKKADTILALEDQMRFVALNIDQLQNMKTMDEEKKALIISRQKAQIEMWRKKSEKLRAQLVESEKDAAVAINSDNQTIRQAPADDYMLD